MTQAIAALSSQSRFGMRQAGLWAGAAAIVLAAHVTVGYALQSMSFTDMPEGGPPPALVVEMAPLAISPAVPEETAMLDAVAPEPPDAVEETEKPDELKPVTDPAPEPVEEQAEPVAEQPVDSDKAQETEQAEQAVAALDEQKPLDEVVPDPVEAISPDVVVPLPEPRPVEAEKKADKPVEAKKKAEKKPVEKPKERPKKEKAPTPKTVTTASVDAKAAAKPAAPKSSQAAGRSGDSKNWEAKMRSWLNRHKRYPSAAKGRRSEGTVYVTFTADASGQVLSARVTRSSGDGDLDRAALAVLQGATVPAPGQRESRTVPFAFNLD